MTKNRPATTGKRRTSSAASGLLTPRKSKITTRSRGVGSRKSWLERFFSSSHIVLYVLGGLLFISVACAALYFFFVNPYSFRWRAMLGEPTYPEGYDIRGIDISHYQGEIQWDMLRNATINNDPIRFVFIKATEGISLMDENFNENFYQAKNNDFIRGAYHFFTPDCSPERQARYFLHQVHLEPGDLPPVLDVEKIGNLSRQELRQRVKRWLDIVENAYGVKPILYTGYKFKTTYLNDTIFNAYPYWIAHYYVDRLRYQGPWSFWQHTDRGRVAGITGDVDVNIFNGNLEQLMNLTLKEEDME